jgi:hypothetical protein
MEQNKQLGSTAGLKPFKRPRLQVYGDLKDITKAKSNMGTRDGGTPPNSKTSS